MDFLFVVLVAFNFEKVFLQFFKIPELSSKLQSEVH